MSTHEHALLELSGLREVVEETGVATLIDRGFQGMARGDGAGPRALARAGR
jgi:hypothetical protein